MILSISVRDFRRKMADALNRVAYRGEQIALTRHGEVVAVLVSYKDVQELRRYREQSGGVDHVFEEIAEYVVDKNEDLYKKLAE
ncbi:MAG: type II toxin-antitoxin system Phd/YefM family antitoxin [Deltaproteobacteria bacterium]|nr:type II toxin-antitoxin system Phd/YefM family antitoxin [Deltaproteobacteria bacterium]